MYPALCFTLSLVASSVSCYCFIRHSDFWFRPPTLKLRWINHFVIPILRFPHSDCSLVLCPLTSVIRHLSSVFCLLLTPYCLLRPSFFVLRYTPYSLRYFLSSTYSLLLTHMITQTISSVFPLKSQVSPQVPLLFQLFPQKCSPFLSSQRWLSNLVAHLCSIPSTFVLHLQL